MVLYGAGDAIVSWATVATSKKNCLAEGISRQLLTSSWWVDGLNILQLLDHDAVILVDLSPSLPFCYDGLHDATFGQSVQIGLFELSLRDLLNLIQVEFLVDFLSLGVEPASDVCVDLVTAATSVPLPGLTNLSLFNRTADHRGA